MREREGSRASRSVKSYMKLHRARVHYKTSQALVNLYCPQCACYLRRCCTINESRPLNRCVAVISASNVKQCFDCRTAVGSKVLAARTEQIICCVTFESLWICMKLSGGNYALRHAHAHADTHTNTHTHTHTRAHTHTDNTML